VREIVQMPLEAVIEIDAARLLPRLLLELWAAGFSVRPVGVRAGRVVDRRAVDADEALCELRFFLRAWARAHGDVAVSVLSAV
jgi:hypothetical protein